MYLPFFPTRTHYLRVLQKHMALSYDFLSLHNDVIIRIITRLQYHHKVPPPLLNQCLLFLQSQSSISLFESMLIFLSVLEPSILKMLVFLSVLISIFSSLFFPLVLARNSMNRMLVFLPVVLSIFSSLFFS